MLEIRIYFYTLDSRYNEFIGISSLTIAMTDNRKLRFIKFLLYTKINFKNNINFIVLFEHNYYHLNGVLKEIPELKLIIIS
jgi:hypothetical protein